LFFIVKILLLLMKYTKKDLLTHFNKEKIEYQLHNHKPLFTVDQSKDLRGKISGIHTKNLFLKDKKNNFFLLSCIEDKKIDLKTLKTPLKAKNLSFASHSYLGEIMSLKPGAVSPFGLINDINKVVNFYLDKDIFDGSIVNFHPIENNATITMNIDNFKKFINLINVKLNIIDLSVYKIERT